MCHGAGGMAGHVEFGARTGGSARHPWHRFACDRHLPERFGRHSHAAVPAGDPRDHSLLNRRPGSAGSAPCDIPKDKGERFAFVITGALAVWNVGLAFVFGLAAYWLNKKGLLRL